MKGKIGSNNSIEISDYAKELVIARIDAQVPSNLKLSIGSFGGMSKDEMIKHIKNDDEVGKQIVRSHLRFLKAQSSGELTKALVSAE